MGGGIPMIQDEQVDICLTPIDWERLATLEAHAASLQLVPWSRDDFFWSPEE